MLLNTSQKVLRTGSSLIQEFDKLNCLSNIYEKRDEPLDLFQTGMECRLVLTLSTGWTSLQRLDWTAARLPANTGEGELHPQQGGYKTCDSLCYKAQPLLSHFCSFYYREWYMLANRKLFLLILLGIVPGFWDERVTLGNTLSDNDMKKHSDGHLFQMPWWQVLTQTLVLEVNRK